MNHTIAIINYSGGAEEMQIEICGDKTVVTHINNTGGPEGQPFITKVIAMNHSEVKGYIAKELLLHTFKDSKERFTYRDLKNHLNSFSESDLDKDATIFDGEEYREIDSLKMADEKFNDVLDHGHIYIELRK